MRLGIGTYTFAWAIGVPGAIPARPLSALDLLEAAAQLGVRVVQFCDNLPLSKLPEPELESFHQRARERGLELELGTRGLAPENLRAHVRLARRFGCQFLRVVIDSPGDEPSAEEAVARLKAMLPEFEAAGVRLAIENHDRFRSATLAWMVEELGRERVGICLDTVNSFGALEGPDVVVRNLGQYTLCLHVKDFTIRRAGHQMGFVVEGCAAGQGRLDVPWLLAALVGCPHPFNAILETWVTPGEDLEETLRRERAWAEAGVRYLRGMIHE
jgi:sugar phosphate isomerase/epimerase